MIALGRRRLADGERDLALRLREASQRIHQQQHVLALRPEILGNRRRQPRAVQPHQRRIVSRRRDDDGTAHTFLAQRLLDEVLDLAAAFTDQPDDDHVGRRIARHHRQQHRLADAGPRKQSHALSTSDAQERVDRTYADVERLANRLPLERVDRFTEQRNAGATKQRRTAVKRFATAVQYTPKQRIADHYFRRIRHRDHARVRRDTAHVADRHQVQAISGKADHLGLDAAALLGHDIAAAAERSVASLGLHREPDGATQLALDDESRCRRPLEVRLEMPRNVRRAVGNIATLKAVVCSVLHRQQVVHIARVGKLV